MTVGIVITDRKKSKMTGQGIQSAAEVAKEFGSSSADTGAASVQIALLTARLRQLNGHFKDHPKDHHSRRGLLKLVGRRRRLMKYLAHKNADQYVSLLKNLKIRG